MKTPFFSPRGRASRTRPICRLLVTLSLLLLSASSAWAQFPRVESFKNNSATGFTVGGSAILTGGGLDPNGAGYLRLTSAETNQSGYIVDNTAFAAPQGFSISFEFFSYGGTGADGFACFLFDGTTSGFTPGASGGSLGYAQKTASPASNGVRNGYIGIGIDEWGNFANPTEGRVGGRVPGVLADGRTPDAVSIRGAGNGSSDTDYPYLDGSGQLPFSLDVSTARAQIGSGDFRRAYIDLVPVGGAYQVTVRIQHGNEVTSFVRGIQVPTPPPTLRIGFAGSTGGSTNIHEIRNLQIVKSPFANDDLASTPFNQAVTLNVLANDVAPGSNFDPASIDLDINTDGIQQTRIVAGQGRFVVNAQGEIIFTPSGTFAGAVTIPYTVKNVLGDQSSPANIAIIVTGADIATTVSGPSAANPGSRITYTLNTSNLGTEPATNVMPTLTLAPALPAASLTLPAGASYNPGTGVVTFASIATLRPDDNPVGNSITFTLPATGTTFTGTGNASSDTPDPVLTNNSSTISTTLTGLANVSMLCAEPGRDGVGELVATSIANTYYQVVSGTTLNTGNTSIALESAPLGSTPISAGDVVLIMQMQGDNLNTTSTSSYGSSVSNYTAGRYEYGIAASDVPVSGGTLTLVKALVNNYVSQDYGPTAAQRRFQVIRVPQYASLTVTGTVTGPAWNGRVGGVLALDVAGRTTFGTNSSLNMDAAGFRGGGGRALAGPTGSSYNNQAWRAPASNPAHGSKGESYAGTPQYVSNGSTIVNTAVEGYPNGSYGRGAPGNGGGGGTDFTPADNSGNAGGGGGGNGGAGGMGGYGRNSGGAGSQAIGGRAAGGSSASRMFLGGGGGAGSRNGGGNALLSSGGIGGGIIVLRTSTVAGTGTLRANGGAAPNVGNAAQGGGGGGAGGTVLVLATSPAGIANGLNSLTISASGGGGSNANIDATGDNGRVGPGGGGGGGLIYSNGAFTNSTASGTSSPVSGGSNGTTRTNATVAFGAGSGSSGVITTNTAANTVPLVAGAGACEPTLTAAMSSSPQTVSRVGGTGSAVNPTTYTITVANTGGAVRNVRVTAVLADNIVSYDNSVTPTVTLQLANGTAVAATGFTLPADGTSTAVFGGFAIPAGASLTLKFQAKLAATAQDNVAYQASVLLSYLDPTRLTTTRTIQPGQTYESYAPAGAGIGAAPGSGYSGSSSAAEDVTISKPLPVTLTAFDAIASGRNAVLTWKTATELNNDRFELERSFDGATFETIGSQRGQGTTTIATNYRYIDAGAARLVAKLLYYRLRQVDTDGTSTYSDVRTVQFERRQATAGLYPNPQQGRFTLDLLGLPKGSYQVEILDLAGRQVLRTQLSGGQEHSMLVPTLPQGSYIVRVSGQSVNITLPMTRN